MTSIIISREYAHLDSLRVYSVFINGKKEGEIESEEIIEIPVQPGDIEIYLRLEYFFRSKKIRMNILPGQVVRFICYPSTGWYFVLPIVGHFLRYIRNINFEKIDRIDLSPNKESHD